MSKSYALLDDGETLRGILIDLFLQDNFDVFCMYVDQDMAKDTGLQFIGQGTPHHVIGAIVVLFYVQPRAAAYLEKVLSRTTNIIFPHIENLDLILYHVAGKPIIRHKPSSYLVEGRQKNKTITLEDMTKHSNITLLRLALDMYKGLFLRSEDPNNLSQSPELLRIIAQHTSAELLIKETMKFFENSFFLTIYSAPSERSVYPEVIFSANMDTLQTSLQTRQHQSGQSVQLIIGMVLEHPGQQSLAAITLANAQQLLTQCLIVFNGSSLEEQTVIIRNLNQLAIVALRNKRYQECLFLTRALTFCCLSAPAPTVEFHDILLRSIFLFGTLRHVQDVQAIASYLQKVAANYLKGLPEPERVLLYRSNPSLVRRIMGEESVQTLFDRPGTSSTGEVESSVSVKAPGI